MDTGQRLSVPAQTGNLDGILEFVRESAEALGVAPQNVYPFILAVDEATTNVILHGYAGQPGMIELEISREGADLVVCLLDRAPEFDPTGVAPPDLTSPLEERDPGRLGVYLIRQFMDDVTYRPRPGGGNMLTLRKKAA